MQFQEVTFPAGEDAPPLPLLIAGLPGVPGYNAFFRFRKRYGQNVIGIKPPHTRGMLYPGVQTVDMERPAELQALFKRYRFASVIDATGCCALKSCEYNPELARLVNVDIGYNLMLAARETGSRLLRLSTDLVFDGRPYIRNGMQVEGSYNEEWPTSPVTVYGKSMAFFEDVLQKEWPQAAILRIALPMGPSFNGHAGAVDWIESRFKKGRPATLYFDEVRNSLYVQDINRVLDHFLRGQQQGIWHLGGPRPMSLYRTAQIINRAGSYPPELLKGCLRAEAGPIPPRAGNVGMDCGKLQAEFGPLNPWPAEDSLVPDGLDWHARGRGRRVENHIAQRLYGYGYPDAWDHPLSLVPEAGVRPAKTIRAAAAHIEDMPPL